MSRLIQSTQNPLVKFALQLLKANHRAEQRLFLVYGWREIALALKNGQTPKTIFLPTQYDDRNSNWSGTILEYAPTSTIVYASDEVIEKLCYGDMRNEPVGVFVKPEWNLDRLPSSVPAPLIAILDQIEKPGNVGAMLRTADASGVTAVIATNPRCDPLNPNAIRSSRGSIFTVPVAVASLSDTSEWLQRFGIRVYATRVDATRTYSDFDYRGPTAFLFGNESLGLSDSWNDIATESIKLPMLGQADSLNVSNTAAVLFYEALRQRSVAS